MTPSGSILWRREDIPADEATVHALVIGVSRYDHFQDGAGEPSSHPLLTGLSQLSAAASSAVRVALWMRDNFDFPDVHLGSVRLLASPSPDEIPLPGGVEPVPATYEEVKRALYEWRREARATMGNVTLLYVAGHGMQTSNEGGILFLQDAGDPNFAALDRALDVSSIRLGMVADLTEPHTHTPPIQYYFYDACRVQPPVIAHYQDLRAGIFFDEPRGAAADMSKVLWGSRSRDYALADVRTRTTLFSRALTDTLDSRATPDSDGRTVRFAPFCMAMETIVDELAQAEGEEQIVVNGGVGQLRTPIYLRPCRPAGDDSVGEASGRNPDLSNASSLVVRTMTDEPRGITVSGKGVLVEGLTGEEMPMPPGRYSVVIDQPWGGSVRGNVEVPSGTPRTEVTIEAPAQSTGSVADAPRLIRQLGPRGGLDTRWFLRFLTWTRDGLRIDAEFDPPAVKVDDLNDDTVSMILHARREAPAYAQLRAEDGRSLAVALLMAEGTLAHTCWLHVRLSSTTLGAVVRLAEPRADLCAGYLIGGRPDHVVTLASTAESLLYSKMTDPIAAAIGGYALLRLNELNRLHDWADNLANWFDWLPDGAVIAGELAARRGQLRQAMHYFELASQRGVPLFSEGLSLMAGRVPRLLNDTDASATAGQLQDLADPIVTLSPSADFAALATTLHVDPDEGPITEDRGWRRFVPTRRAAGPRDFWTAP